MSRKSKHQNAVVMCSLCGYLGPITREPAGVKWRYVLLAATGIGLIPVAVLACARGRSIRCPSCRTTRCITVTSSRSLDQ